MTNIKRIAFCFPLLLFIHYVQAQNSPSPAFGINVAFANPINNFAQSEYFGYQGFAHKSIGLDLDYTACFGKRLGFNFSLNSAVFKMDEDAIVDMYNNALGQEGGIEVKTGSYTSSTFIVNPMFRLKVKDVGMHFFAGLGVGLCTHPEITAADTDYGEIRNLQRGVDFALVKSYGMSLHYWINEKAGIKAGFRRIAIQTEFTDENMNHFLTGGATSYYLDFDYQMISLGYIIKL